MILLLFQLLSLFWGSELVSVCMAFLRPAVLRSLEDLLSFLDTNPAGFHCQIFWGLLFSMSVSHTGEPYVGWNPSPLNEDFASDTALLILSHHTVEVGQVCSVSPPLLD